MADLIDVGANLTHESFCDDLPAVMARAAGSGVRRLVVTGTTLAGSEAALSLARLHPGVLWATAGVHPHCAADFDDATEERLRALLRDPLVVATGECGLDYFRDFSPREAQRSAFARQLELAVASKRPLFLHQRDAHGDFLAMLKEQGTSLPAGVAHCFTNGPDELADYLDVGLYIGVTGWICDERRAADLRAAVARLPLDRVVVETDAPYLLPRTIRPAPRTRRNEPAWLTEVVRKLAEFMGQSPERVAEATTNNAERLFGLSVT
ncbi:MAG: TatD family hydrolase [Gammaproteobacteria bacterium]|nr:TatD family hydrolase [Gammaproteobacteria bacterium]